MRISLALVWIVICASMSLARAEETPQQRGARTLAHAITFCGMKIDPVVWESWDTTKADSFPSRSQIVEAIRTIADDPLTIAVKKAGPAKQAESCQELRKIYGLFYEFPPEKSIK